MITKYLDLLFAPFFKKLLIWAQEYLWRTLFSVFLLIVILGFGIMLSKWLTFGKLLSLLFQSFLVVRSFSLQSYVYLLWMTILFVFGIILYLGWKVKSAKYIEVKIKRNSKVEDYFVVPPGADWSLVPDDDTLGNVLSVTRSGLTGHLIKGNDWCNYHLTFKTKIIFDNFTFAIRVIDKNNCIFFQCGKRQIFPHLIMGGIAIRHFKDIDLPFDIPKEKWVDVSVLVKGEKVVIKIMGIEREFDIPHGPWFIEKGNLSFTLEYKVVEEDTRKALITDNIYKEVSKEEGIEEIVRKISMGILEKIKLDNYHTFNFDYYRGTIGFRQSENEHALFKDIKVKLLDKI